MYTAIAFKSDKNTLSDSFLHKRMIKEAHNHRIRSQVKFYERIQAL